MDKRNLVGFAAALVAAVVLSALLLVSPAGGPLRQSVSWVLLALVAVLLAVAALADGAPLARVGRPWVFIVAAVMFGLGAATAGAQGAWVNAATSALSGALFATLAVRTALRTTASR